MKGVSVLQHLAENLEVSIEKTCRCIVANYEIPYFSQNKKASPIPWLRHLSETKIINMPHERRGDRPRRFLVEYGRYALQL